MKKSTKTIALSLAAATLLSGAAAFGKNLAKQIDIYYRDIKININGKEILPTNSDGETVEPFIYEGTTYLPVRAVADAVGMEVNWDDKTSTIFLAEKTAEEVPSELTQALKLYSDIDSRLSDVFPKNELDNEILFNIEGVPMSAACLKYAVLACGASHENKTDDETKAIMKKEIEEYFRSNAALVNLASELGIDLTEEEFRQSITPTYESLKAIYGDDLDAIIEGYTHQTTYYYFLTAYYNELYAKVCKALLLDNDFVETVTTKALDEMTNGDKPYVRAKHILIAFDENATEEDKAAALTLANDVYSKAASGEDFDELIAEYGKDPGVSTYPDGYYFTEGMMVEPFEKTSFELKEGEISKPVETNFGYHIILRLPLDDKEAIKTSDNFKKHLTTQVNELLTEKGMVYEIVYSPKYASRYADFEKLMSESNN